MASLHPDAYYQQLGQLIASMPDLTIGPNPVAMQWLAKAYALLVAGGARLEAIELKSAGETAMTPIHPSLRQGAVNKVHAAALRALYAAELRASVPAQGSFIAAGNAHDAFVGISRAIGVAKRDVLFVDKYMDEQTLEYARSSPEAAMVRLLAGTNSKKASLQPALAAWRRQFPDTRRISLRLAADNLLHDRLLIVDQQTVWAVSQSMNALAARSPASILRTPSDVAQQKISSYEAFWDEGAEA